MEIVRLETSKFRDHILKKIEELTEKEIKQLKIIDIGCGKDPLIPNCDKFERDDHRRYYRTLKYGGDYYIGDAARASQYIDKLYDVVYSSHCLEDFPNTTDIMVEWKKLLLPGGLMVLLLPDQPMYIRKCKRFNHVPNGDHKHEDFALEYMKKRIAEAGMEFVYTLDFCKVIDDEETPQQDEYEYNFMVICK